MTHVDALSRQIGYIESIPLERELELKQFKQLQDVKIKEIARKLEYANDDKFELIDGLVYKEGADRSCFVVPDIMHNSIIRAHHDDMAHCDA